MAGVFRREGARKWRFWYVDANNKRVYRTGFADKRATRQLAEQKEHQARMDREGFTDPADRSRRTEAARPIAEHLADWQRDMASRGGNTRYPQAQANAVARLLSDAKVTTARDLSRADLIQGALGRLRAIRSPRTCNHALAAVKSLVVWLHDCDRITELPRGLMKLKPYNAKVDRKRIRRAASSEEIAAILDAAESGPEMFATLGSSKSRFNATMISGADRAALYRLALGTGFRAAELRSLTPANFHLEGDEPYVVCQAAFTKNGKEAAQPISRADAEFFRRFLAGRDPSQKFVIVPRDTAKLLRGDLERAGIPYKTEAGYLDFHALRKSYITHLVMSGVNVKVVQVLARHSSITLTMDVYTQVTNDDLRKALEGKGK